MHDSAHDKSQRRRGVLRRGKCVQRALRDVVTRLRTRRTLIATAALVLLLAFLALCHARLLSQRPAHRDGAHDNTAADAVADDSTSHVTASPTDRWLLRPDAQHGGSVRVMLLMVSTHVSEQLCYALASAYFADLPVVVLGYGNKYKSHIWRWQVYLDAIQRAGLRDRDVVLLLDSDILFSGEDMLPFIDDYIARSPAAPSALDVRAVRAGTARAPSMFESQYVCYAEQTYGTFRACTSQVNPMFNKIIDYVKRTGVEYALPNLTANPLQYVNGGVSIHRVWSVREVARALQHYVATHKPRVELHGGWYDDQSVLALFYNDLRAWEVDDDVLRTNSNRGRSSSSTATAVTAQRGPHGLRAGQLQIDHTGRLSTGVNKGRKCPLELTDELWRDDATSSAQERQLAYADPQQYAADVWRRYGDSVRLQRRTLTRVSNGTHTVDLAPLLLSLKPRYIYGMEQAAVRVHPFVLHVHGKRKQSRTDKVLQVLPWYVPMRYNATRWQQASAQVLASPIELWTATMNATRRVRYGDVCQYNPFLTQP